MSKKLFKTLVSSVLVFSMLFAFTGLSAHATTEEELQAQIDANNAKIEQLKEQQAAQSDIVAALKKQDALYDSQLDDLNSQVDAYTSQINQKSAEIEEMQAQITALENEIASVNTKIDEQNKQVDATYELLSERLNSMYRAGQTTDIEVLLSAGDFSEFLTRSELLRRVSEHDTALVSDLEDQIKELNKMVESLNSKKSEQQQKKSKLDDEKYDLVVARADLQEKVDEVQKTANQIEAQRKANAEKLSKLVDMESYYSQQNAEYDKKILALQASKGDGAPTGDNFKNNMGFKVSSKGFICPLQYADTYVSAGYPYYPSGNSHTGVDYCCRSGTYGKNVRAAAGGTVISVKYLTTSYGYHVVIDHGNGITTLYGHGSQILVSEGQHVDQGQIIMLAGSTGNSTGPHVHLGVAVNGSWVDPEDYVVLP